MLVTVLDEARIEFQDGDLVTFSEIRGIEVGVERKIVQFSSVQNKERSCIPFLTENYQGINEAEPRKVKVLSPYTFIISASGLSGTYENGGYVHQVN